MVCRMCKGTELANFLDLGFTPPADQFLRKEQLREPVTYYPLEVLSCRQCGLAQLSHVVSPEILYRQDYPYESSTTRTGREHWREFAQTTVAQLGLGADSLVVDVGSNVGVLLEQFRDQGTRILGVDPAANIVRIAERRGIETWAELFGIDVARKIVAEKGHASLVTATNVFAHIDDLDACIAAIDTLLGKRGVFIFEAPYFLNLIRQLEYDTIYHEHLSYLAVKPVVRFFARHGFEVFDVQQRDIHGGSFRVFTARRGERPVSPIVQEMLEGEEAAGLDRMETLHEFSRAVQRNRDELLWLLRSLKHEGKRIVGVSAPAKGMTLLNYCRIGRETLDFVTEKAALKIGRFTPGAHIPVVGDDELLRQQPDFALLLAWNFAKEIMENLREYREAGGKFIVPIPTPHVVG
jgi:SAM-dependent methyltransferase